ncbi:MAG: siroheme synthase CysG [Gammaproteobacteria bacterium]|nr:siroheme synthase CysG [Gammaproteobacteria bacterium]MDP2141186.1 siroheme synthase CysG [Gammaproteobacteria bacterium]MDP2349140.1 siroheme synthase CysG [Gammaproteobacteria bacterium]
MQFLPIFLNVRAQTCLVVGGGDVAYRKAVLLDRAGARLRVVAPGICAELETLVIAGAGELRVRGFTENDMDGVFLAVAATDDEEVNAAVSVAAKARGLPVNVVDKPSLCSFIVPAIVDRSPVVIAISSGGASPVLTRKLKEKLETMVPAAYGRLALLLGGYRGRVKSVITDFKRRTRFWERLLSGPLSEIVLAGKEDEGRRYIEQQLSESDNIVVQGEVYLVGAGPGDPDLLTLKALRLMQEADVVLYDRLVSKEIMARVRPDAEKINVGKERSNHLVPQEEINDMLVRLAQEGKKVLRLKGGDPFIFGRGGEEIDRLAEAGIPFQVIPGITAASGCACYAGIPLTHRDCSQSVRFVTGHLKNDSIDLDWPNLANENQTVVFYMGLVGLETICEQLIAHGMAADMPIALVQQGTTPNQKVITGTLETMPAIMKVTEVQAPTIIIVGRVVKLQSRYSWFKGAAIS